MKLGVSSRKNKTNSTIGIVRKPNKPKINVDRQTDRQTDRHRDGDFGWKLPSLVKEKNTRVGSPTNVGDVILVRRRKDPGPTHVTVVDGHERYCTYIGAGARAS